MIININGQSLENINDKLGDHNQSIETMGRGRENAENVMYNDIASGNILTQNVQTTHSDMLRTSGVYAMGEYFNRNLG